MREEFRRILRFWLDRGVDGFRVDVAHGMIKADGLPDYTPPAEGGSMGGAGGVAVPVGGPAGGAAGSVGSAVGRFGVGARRRHARCRLDGVTLEPAISAELGDGAPYWGQEGVHEIYRDWRALLDEYPGERILAAEAWVDPLPRVANWVRPDEMHQAFNFAYLETPWNAPALRTVVDDSLAAFGAVGAPSTWVLSNHDVVRHATRLSVTEANPQGHGLGPRSKGLPAYATGLRRARAATALMLALPGSSYLYQGEELGLPEVIDLPDDARQDPTWFRTDGERYGRDGCRVPIPWEADAPNYGFGPAGDPWLPQPAQWAELARDRQRGVPGLDPLALPCGPAPAARARPRRRIASSGCPGSPSRRGRAAERRRRRGREHGHRARRAPRGRAAARERAPRRPHPPRRHDGLAPRLTDERMPRAHAAAAARRSARRAALRARTRAPRPAASARSHCTPPRHPRASPRAGDWAPTACFTAQDRAPDLLHRRR